MELYCSVYQKRGCKNCPRYEEGVGCVPIKTWSYLVMFQRGGGYKCLKDTVLVAEEISKT